VAVLESSIKRFIGLSSDAKPTEGVPAGSSFLETDTGHIARFDGDGWREAVDPAHDANQLLAELLAETQRITRLLCLAANIEPEDLG
jgi:hypothetical protein